MKTVARFEFREERKSDCFLYICEKLTEDNFRRLRCYRPRKNIEFSAWLTAVVFNLCVDWHRMEFGRAVLPPAISTLPAFDQFVYRYHFEQGMPASEALEVLRADYPEIDRKALSRAMTRIHRIMTPRQRWQASVRLRRRQGQTVPNYRKPEHLPSNAPEPFSDVRVRQQRELLQTAMEKLSLDERLILRLRYQEGLTLRQIARHMDLADTNQAWRCAQKALQRLARLVRSQEPATVRKK